MSSQNMKRAGYDNVYLHSVCSCYLTSWIKVLTRVAVASFYTKWPKICQPMTEQHFCFPKHMIKIVYATNRTLGSHGHVTKFMARLFFLKFKFFLNFATWQWKCKSIFSCNIVFHKGLRHGAQLSAVSDVSKLFEHHWNFLPCSTDFSFSHSNWKQK